MKFVTISLLNHLMPMGSSAPLQMLWPMANQDEALCIHCCICSLNKANFLITAMTSLISTTPYLSSPAVYPSWAISVHSSTIFFHSQTISAQSSATCANVMAVTRDFVALSSIVCIAQCDNKFVLSASSIAENLQRCDRALCTTYKGKEVLYDHSYNDE